VSSARSGRRLTSGNPLHEKFADNAEVLSSGLKCQKADYARMLTSDDRASGRSGRYGVTPTSVERRVLGPSHDHNANHLPGSRSSSTSTVHHPLPSTGDMA
jgi:hypothetical protein